jgi:hypothetical protein
MWKAGAKILKTAEAVDVVGTGGRGAWSGDEQGEGRVY